MFGILEVFTQRRNESLSQCGARVLALSHTLVHTNNQGAILIRNRNGSQVVGSSSILCPQRKGYKKHTIKKDTPRDEYYGTMD